MLLRKSCIIVSLAGIPMQMMDNPTLKWGLCDVLPEVRTVKFLLIVPAKV